MQHNIYKSFVLALIFFFVSCKNDVQEKKTIFPGLKTDTGIRYAKRFSLARGTNFTLVYLFGNRNNRDTTATFLLFKDSADIKGLPKVTYALQVPCKKIAALSSIYATIFCELGAGKSLAAIDNIDYVNNSEVISMYKRGELKELARMPQIDIEQTVALQPGIIFTFGMGDGEKDLDKRLEQTMIPTAVSVDHLEESPLARAEWIKFFAAFADKKEKADSIFIAVEKNYFELKKIAQRTKARPTVFNEIKFGDTWYMPGGKSFMAQMLADAGADYLWKEDQKFGSLPLSFEQVFAKAKEADYWINLSTLKTKKELLGFESRYAQFKAFKNGNLYNNTRITNSKGYSIYWETGMIYPNRILSDLILIFHPEFKAEVKSDFFYYEQLK